jgi:hypothetical protein
MTCREIDEALIIAPGRELSSQARSHLVTCESCGRLASAIEAEGSLYKIAHRSPQENPGLDPPVYSACPAAPTKRLLGNRFLAHLRRHWHRGRRTAGNLRLAGA